LLSALTAFKHPIIAAMVEEAITENNKVSHFALCLANGHAMRLIEDNQSGLLPEAFDRAFFAQC
jgi:hypothetical protein